MNNVFKIMEERGCHVIKRNVREDKGVIFYRLRIESSTDDNTGASSEVLESPCKPTDDDFLGTLYLTLYYPSSPDKKCFVNKCFFSFELLHKYR